MVESSDRHYRSLPDAVADIRTRPARYEIHQRKMIKLNAARAQSATCLVSDSLVQAMPRLL